MMVDAVFVGSIPGWKFFSIKREGRQMPLLDGQGQVCYWSDAAARMPEFARVLEALDKPEKLKDITP